MFRFLFQLMKNGGKKKVLCCVYIFVRCMIRLLLENRFNSSLCVTNIRSRVKGIFKFNNRAYKYTPI